jgi:hypothetical protein
VDSDGRTIWIADAHRGDGKRFIVHPDEKLTAFLELESAIRQNSGISVKGCTVASPRLVAVTESVSLYGRMKS